MITYSLLDKYNEIAHFCTTRHGGTSVGNYASFNLSPFSGDNDTHFSENRQKLCAQLGIPVDRLIIPFQTHETEVSIIDEQFFQQSDEQKTAFLNGVDALVTAVPGICIGVNTADCVPLTFFDPRKKVIAVAHAGWRGTCGRIAEKTIRQMLEKFECNPGDILVSIGPSISVDAYQVGDELIAAFNDEGFDTAAIFVRKGEKLHLDLWEANRQSLLKAGILYEHIGIAGICTYTEHERFFSARRLGIKSGRMLSGIMLNS